MMKWFNYLKVFKNFGFKSKLIFSHLLGHFQENLTKLIIWAALCLRKGANKSIVFLNYDKPKEQQFFFSSF